MDETYPVTIDIHTVWCFKWTFYNVDNSNARDREPYELVTVTDLRTVEFPLIRNWDYITVVSFECVDGTTGEIDYDTFIEFYRPF